MFRKRRPAPQDVNFRLASLAGPCYDAAMTFRAKHRWLIILRRIAGTDA
jgi:hypothetical protein